MLLFKPKGISWYGQETSFTKTNQSKHQITVGENFFTKKNKTVPKVGVVQKTI